MRKVLQFIAFFGFFMGDVLADSCVAPTGILAPNVTLQSQFINLSDAVSQKEFYYAVDVQANETLTFYTEIDGLHADSVDTFATLMDSSCQVIADASVSASTPRRTSITRTLATAGTYYLRVQGKATYDGSNQYSDGYFQVRNHIDAALADKEISIWKRGPSSVESGEHFTYTISVYNDGLEDTTSLIVVDTLPTNISYEGVNAGWTCTQSGQNVTCALDSDILVSGAPIDLNLQVEAKILAFDTHDASTNNSATATATYADSSTQTATDMHPLTIKGEDAKISIFKSATKNGSTISKILQNETFKYHLNVQNQTGNNAIDLSSVIVEDDVDSDFSVQYPIQADTSVWDCTNSSGQHVECVLKSDLGNWQSQSFDILVKATGALRSGISNLASVSANTPTGAEIGDTKTITVDLVGENFAVDFTKTSAPKTVTIGDNTVYTFTVTNTSNAPLTTVRVEDVIPLGFLKSIAFVDKSAWTCQEPILNNKIDCNLTSALAVDASKSLKVSAKALVIQNDVINTASVVVDSGVSASASAKVNIVDFVSNMRAQKTASQDVVLEGDTFTYTISTFNDGDGNETSVVMTDNIPSDFNVTAVSAGADWTCPTGPIFSNALVCMLNANLLPHSSASDIIITVKEVKPILSDRTVENKAVLTSTKNAGGKEHTKSVLLKAIQNALKIRKNVSPFSVYTDEAFDYTIEIDNTAQRDILNVHVEDILPSGVVYDSYVSSNGWTCDYNASSARFSCDEGNFSQTTEVLTLHVKAPSSEGNITNSVIMTSALDAQVREANVSKSILAKNVKLKFTEHSSSKNPAGIGEVFRYGIQVENIADNAQNNTVADGVKVVVELDANLTYHDNSGTDSSWVCVPSASTVTCTLSTPLAAHEVSKPIYLNVSSAVEAYTISNLKLSSTQNTTAVTTSIAVDVYDAIVTNLGIHIDDSRDPVLSSSDFSYLIEVSNSGSAKVVRDVIVEVDTLSAIDFTYLNVSGAGWNCSKVAKKATCHLDLLAAQSQSSLELNVTAPDANGTLLVRAKVYSDVVNDSDMSDNQEEEETQVIKYFFNQNNLRSFSKVYMADSNYTNIYGDIITIGNQALCKGGSKGSCEEPNDPINDNVYQTRINLDSSGVGAGALDTATNAGFTISANDEVIWAGLYWMGMIDRYQGDTNKIQQANKVYLRHDANTTYIPVQSEVNKFNWHNDLQDSTFVFGYQGVADVTEYVRKNRGGTYWVSDIQTSEGTNLSAGWSLVVVVQDRATIPTRTLKNLTLFDGFQAVWKNVDYKEADQYPDLITQTVNGFLTPNHGAISSKVSYFSLEGDKTLHDQVSITNKSNVVTFLPAVADGLNDVDDVMNGTVTNHNRAPALTNTSGVDIDTFDVSTVMEHGQSSTDITIYSEGDRFYLGMFNFSTNMYLPRICYVETMTDDLFQPLSGREVSLGDKVGFMGYVRNDENETARKMTFRIAVDNLFQEVNNTLEIQNVSEVSFSANPNDYISTFIDTNTSNDANETVDKTTFDVHVGVGASSLDGGDMVNGDVINFRYQGIVDSIPDNNRTKNIYSISYKVDYMGVVPQFEMRSCSDINRSIIVRKHSTRGFGITHKDGYQDSDTDSADDNISKNNLFMQVVGKDYSVDVLALEEDAHMGRSHIGEVRLELVKMDQNVSHHCADYTTISQQFISFNHQRRVPSILAQANADKMLTYRVTYPISRYGLYPSWSGGVPASSDTDIQKRDRIEVMLDEEFGVNNPCKAACTSSASLEDCRACVYDKSMHIIDKPTCAHDVFSIRPAKMLLDANESSLVGGKDYTLNLESGNIGYLGTFSAPKTLIKRQLIAPASCGIDDNHTYNKTFTFVDGNASLSTFKYTNVGDINLTYHDSAWSEVDQNSSDSTMSDCVVGEANNTASGDGKFGCDVYGEKMFSFKPSNFVNDVQLINQGGGTFTYLDDSGMQRAQALLSIRAVLADGTPATNYTAGCFAKDINYTFSGVGTYLISMITFADAGDVAGANPNDFETSEGNFTAGVASPIVGINFARTNTVAINPFELNASKLYIAVMDADGVVGYDFTNKDGNATYYYARLYAPDYLSIKPSLYKAGLFYEVYCGVGCEKSKMGLGGLPESPDYVEWIEYNAGHISTPLDYGSVSSLNGLVVNAAGSMAVDLNLTPALSRPHCDRVSLRPASWLEYDKYNATHAQTIEFKACFVSQGIWAGKGALGMTVDTNISLDKHIKIDW